MRGLAAATTSPMEGCSPNPLLVAGTTSPIGRQSVNSTLSEQLSCSDVTGISSTGVPAAVGALPGCWQRLKALRQIEFSFAISLAIGCLLFISLVGVISESVVISGNETVVVVAGDENTTTGPVLYTSRSHHPIASRLISSLENATGK